MHPPTNSPRLVEHEGRPAQAIHWVGTEGTASLERRGYYDSYMIRHISKDHSFKMLKGSLHILLVGHWDSNSACFTYIKGLTCTVFIHMFTCCVYEIGHLRMLFPVFFFSFSLRKEEAPYGSLHLSYPFLEGIGHSLFSLHFMRPDHHSNHL